MLSSKSDVEIQYWGSESQSGYYLSDKIKEHLLTKIPDRDVQLKFFSLINNKPNSFLSLKKRLIPSANAIMFRPLREAKHLVAELW